MTFFTFILVIKSNQPFLWLLCFKSLNLKSTTHRWWKYFKKNNEKRDYNITAKSSSNTLYLNKRYFKKLLHKNSSTDTFYQMNQSINHLMSFVGFAENPVKVGYSKFINTQEILIRLFEMLLKQVLILGVVLCCANAISR